MNVEPWEYEPISDLTYRWGITPEEAEIFLEQIGYYEQGGRR
jgi:hypothetical protein